jgi:hypothetical protein
METHVRQVGEEVISQFPIFDTDGVSYLSGVSPGDFEISEFRDDASAVVSATVAEIGSTGMYRVRFTPTEQAQWAVIVKLPTTGDVWGMLVRAYSELSRDIAEAQMNAAYDDDASVLFLETWLDRGGRTVPAADLVSCSVTVYTASGTALFTVSSITPKADGHFGMSQATPLDDNRPYSAMVTIEDSIGNVTTSQAFTTVG